MSATVILLSFAFLPIRRIWRYVQVQRKAFIFTRGRESAGSHTISRMMKRKAIMAAFVSVIECTGALGVSVILIGNTNSLTNSKGPSESVELYMRVEHMPRVRGVNFTIYTLQVNYSKFTVKIIGALHRAPRLYIGCDVV